MNSEASIAVFIVLVVVLYMRISSWLKCINDDLYDIKKHLKLPIALRTKEKRHEEIISCIDEFVAKGWDKKMIVELLGQLSNTSNFGSEALLGKLKIKKYEEYITFRIKYFKDSRTEKE